jgi:hypothetical protein
VSIKDFTFDELQIFCFFFCCLCFHFNMRNHCLISCQQNFSSLFLSKNFSFIS